MNSYRHNSSRKRLSIATALLVGVFLIDFATGGKIRAFVREGAAMLYSASGAIITPIAQSGFFSSRRALTEENESLKAQVASLQIRSADYQALKEENNSLRQVVRLAIKDPGITAPVVSSFRSSLYGTFLIGAGMSDGVTTGSTVMIGNAETSIALGAVTEVTEHTSLVTQFFAPNVSTDAVIRGIGVTVVGSGGGNAIAHAPRNSPIEIGDSVIAPVLGQKVIGIVNNIVGDETSVSRDIYITLPMSLASISFVYVVASQ